MTTPQDSPRRKKQKIRRAKQLEAWRRSQPAKDAKAPPVAAPAGPKAKKA